MENSPIIHSMPKDAIRSAQGIVGSDLVPGDEALLLAKMKDSNKKKRKMSYLVVIAIIFAVFAIILLSLPNRFFIQKDTGIVIDEKEKNFVRVDQTYGIVIPEVSDVEAYRGKRFSSAAELSEIVIKDTPFKNLSPLVSQRFLDAVIPYGVTNYIYGIVTKESISTQYFAFNFTDRKNIETALLSSERTLYTDLGIIMQLPDVKENEVLQFESVDSVRSPMRILRNLNGETLLVYGFPIDNTVLFARSPEAYNLIRSRMLAGY